MNKKLIIFAIPLLLIAAVLGFTSVPETILVNSAEPTDQIKTPNYKQEINKQTISWLNAITQKLETLLSQKKYLEAVQLIDKIYQQANTDELDQLKGLVLLHADKLNNIEEYSSARILLNEYSITFNDVDSWQKLAETQTYLNDWEGAVTSFLRSSLLEYRPDNLESTLQSVIRAASYVRAGLERKGDELGILNLYQTIIQQHPNYPRFQLELAQSYLRLNDPKSARPLLETLLHDIALGNLAKQKLAKIDAQQNKQKDLSSKIVIPLIRSGNSLLIEIILGGQNLRMLLDTGASITAFSHDTISVLNLSPTGESIQLSTANGVVNSQLFSANKLIVGQIIIQKLKVASIDLKSTNGVNGLLGTDVLNQLGGFIIDNQRNELIIDQ